MTVLEMMERGLMSDPKSALAHAINLFKRGLDPLDEIDHTPVVAEPGFSFRKDYGECSIEYGSIRVSFGQDVVFIDDDPDPAVSIRIGNVEVARMGSREIETVTGYMEEEIDFLLAGLIIWINGKNEQDAANVY